VFSAGKQIDSKGNAKEWTEADLDQMVANFDANDSFPMVIGHPQHNAPAWGWGAELKREGKHLFAKFDKVAQKFIEWGQAGHIRNRSVQILKTPKGFRIGHIGFLGAMPPAVEGMDAIEFSADGETYEFGWSEGYRLGLFARFMRRFREHVLVKHGQEDADALVPLYEVEDLERIAAEEKAKPEPAPKSTFNQNTEIPVSNITQEQLDAAVAQARKEEQDKHNATSQKLRTAEFNSNLATNRAFISTLISDEKGNVRMTPAQAEGWAECLTFAQMQDSAVAEFTFTAADKSEQKNSVYEFLKGKLSTLAPQLKLGQQQADKDPKADLVSEFVAPQGYSADPAKIAQDREIRTYMRAHKTDYPTAAAAVINGR